MEPLFILASLLFGAIAGSFLNALVFRWGTGKSVMRGRSRCMHCNHTLGVLDLVPILSYLFLRGRCRYCAVRISPQYPLVEAAAALLSLVVYLENSSSALGYAFWFMVWMTLLFVVVYDLRHAVIPWSCSMMLALLAGLYLFANGQTSLLDVAAGPLLASPFFLISLVSRGRWMGWGDGALELGLGWLLGLSFGATAIVIAVWSGAAVGLLLILFSQFTPTGASRPSTQRFTIKSEIPFAPFLVLGAFAVYVLHINFFSTLPLLWQ